MPEGSSFSPDETDIPKGLISGPFNQWPVGHEPFVSYEGLEQLHQFLFVLGITHVLYSCLTVNLAMSKLAQMGKSYHSCSGWKSARKEKQGDKAADNLCFSSCFTSMEQESNTHLDGDISSTLYSFISLIFICKLAFSSSWLIICGVNLQLCFLRQFRSSIKKIRLPCTPSGFHHCKFFIY
ncbi:hypothetical protein AHAS_Ahas17G0212000 [Arachis hypogaea]